MAFSVYGRPLVMVTSFEYLVWVISAAGDYLMAAVRNLARARAVRRRLMQLLIREGAAPRVSGFFFKAVVQSVLLSVT